MLHGTLDGLSLHQLGGIDQVLKAAGIEIIVRQITQQLFVSGAALLVIIHDPGQEIPVLRGAEGLNGLHTGQAFKAVFRAEPEAVLPVGRKGQAAVPDHPVVGVSPGRAAGVIKAAAGGGAGGPVEGIRCVRSAELRQKVLIQPQIIHMHQLRILAAAEDHALHLVVAAEQAQGGMVLESRQVIHSLAGKFLLHVLCEPDVCAGHHKILPDQNALFVAEIIERILRVIAAAPDPQGVEIGGKCLIYQIFQPVLGDPGEQAVHGNKVCAHGEDFHTVDDEAEFAALSVGVLLRAHRQCPQADAHCFPVHAGAPDPELRFQRIEGLLAVAPHPPEPGMLDMDHRLTGRCPYPLPVKVYINFIFRPAKHIRTDAHVHLSAPVLLADQHPLQPSAVKAAQLHRAGNAHIRQGRRPVPAGLEHGLAQVGRSGDRIPVIHIEIVPPLGLPEIGHGGGKFQP